MPPGGRQQSPVRSASLGGPREPPSPQTLPPCTHPGSLSSQTSSCTGSHFTSGIQGLPAVVRTL